MAQTHWRENSAVIQTGHFWSTEVASLELNLRSIAGNLDTGLIGLNFELTKKIGMRRNEARAFVMTRSHGDIGLRQPATANDSQNL